MGDRGGDVELRRNLDADWGLILELSFSRLESEEVEI